MRANLDATGARMLAERVKDEAGEESTERALEAADFRAAVAELVGEERADELLDPAGYLGSAGALVDRALDFYDREG